MIRKLLLAILLFIPVVCLAQSEVRTLKSSGEISGIILEANTKEPIEYANIIVFNANDSSQVTGTISNKRGEFNVTPLPLGKYYVNFQFLGYEKVTKEVTLDNNNNRHDVGTIYLKPTAVNLQNVVVEGQRNPISYQIDRKVIDVDQMPVSSTGTAADVLQNVPSVTVDIEGNVSLRGSSNFTVLIDGRPSVLDAQDALQQIPASTIANIEIITNPSAKYDPEGSAGIINIIMKKTRVSGFSGVSNLNAGLNDKYGGDALFEYKVSDFTGTIGVDYNNRFSPGTSKEERNTTFNNITTYSTRNGDSERGRKMMGLRLGIDYRFSDADVISVSGRIGSREMNMSSGLNQFQWNNLSDIRTYFRNNSDSKHSGDFYSGNLNYQRKFNEKGHQLIGEFSVRDRGGEDYSITELYRNNFLSDGKKTLESGPSTEYDGRLDYTLPFGEGSKFEAGYEGEVEISDENNDYYQTDSAGAYKFMPLFSHKAKFNMGQHSLYSLYSGQFGNFGYQAGLRAEGTFRNIKVDNFNEFAIKDWDFFPGLHTSYKFSEGNQVMASYTRRIQRPHEWALEPYISWTSANNVRQGNPSLDPEYIDSYELGFITFLDIFSFSVDGYYRVTNNKIENINSTYAEDVTLSTFDNIGKDFSLGSELMLAFGVGKIWDARIMGNLYDYRIKGSLLNEDFSRRSFNWNTRFNNNLRFGDTQFQVTFMYNSPSIYAQGKREGFFTTDAAIKHDFFNKLLSLTLQVRDLFKTGKMEQTSSGPDFYQYNYFSMEAPMVMLNLKLNINNFKNDDRKRTDSNNNDFEDSEGFQ